MYCTQYKYINNLRDLIPIWLTERRELAQKNLESAQDRQKHLYDRKMHVQKFEKGQLVYLYTPAVKKGKTPKLSHPWHSPFRIVEISGPKLKLIDPTNPRRNLGWVHMTRVKQCHPKISILEKRTLTEVKGTRVDPRPQSPKADSVPLENPPGTTALEDNQTRPQTLKGVGTKMSVTAPPG